MTLEQLMEAAQAHVRVQTKEGYELDWSEDEQCWHTAGWESIFSENEVDRATVKRFHPYGSCTIMVTVDL